MPGGRIPSSATSIDAEGITTFSYRLLILPLLVLFMLAALLTIQPLPVAEWVSDENEQSTPIPAASLENEAKDIKDVVGTFLDFSSTTPPESVSLREEYGRTHAEPVLVNRQAVPQIYQKLLPRPPPEE